MNPSSPSPSARTLCGAILLLASGCVGQVVTGAGAAGGGNGAGGTPGASGGAPGTGGGASGVGSGGTMTGSSVGGSGATDAGAPRDTAAPRDGGPTTGTGGAPAGGTGGAPAGGTGGVTGAAGATGGPCVESSCGSHKWPCWRMPNPVASGATVPNHQSYTDLGNGAVKDNITCLVWEKANPATQGTWQASADCCAALATSSYAGFNDWRMPTRVEMASITDVNNGAKGFASIFTVSAGYYGTSSWWYETITGQNSSGFQFGYGTNGFSSNAVAMSGTNNVARCVRGNGAGEAADAFAKEPPNHYTIAAGEVTDNYTGLIWQQVYSASRMAWADAPAYCAGLGLNGHTGWRVPTLNELTSTVNEALVGPAINRTAFPNTVFCGATSWYWAMEASKVGGVAWGINYCDGFTGWNAASATWNTFPDAYVRCVR